MTENFSLDANQVKTQQDFYNFIEQLAKAAKNSERSLEEYLRALWVRLQASRDKPVSFTMLAQLLSTALTSTIAPFDPTWLRYKNPPRELSQMKPVEDTFAFAMNMLLYQIADLHQMKAEGILDQPPHVLWLGVNRQGGRTWYNFVPAAFLDAGIGPMRADSQETDCDWDILAIFLWLGQNYE